MILLIYNSLSNKLGSLEQLATLFENHKIIKFETIELKITKKGTLYFEEGFDYDSFLDKVLRAKQIFLHFQPTKTDYKNPYKNYFSALSSFFKLHHSIQYRTFLIPPFLPHPKNPLSRKTEVFVNVFKDKSRFDFQEFPFKSYPKSYFPVTKNEKHKLITKIIMYVLSCPRHML
jgi:hypothetical protein